MFGCSSIQASPSKNLLIRLADLLCHQTLIPWLCSLSRKTFCLVCAGTKTYSLGKSTLCSCKEPRDIQLRWSHVHGWHKEKVGHVVGVCASPRNILMHFNAGSNVAAHWRFPSCLYASLCFWAITLEKMGEKLPKWQRKNLKQSFWELQKIVFLFWMLMQAGLAEGKGVLGCKQTQ